MTRPCHRRAFATLYTLVLLGIVGVIVAVLSTQLTRDAKRTGDQLIDAQLRTLLRYGADTVLARPASDSDKPLELPPQLAAEGFVLTLRRDSSDTLITARQGHRMLTQRLTVSAGSPRQVTSAQLER
jgi:hypothetical protein